MEQYIKIYSSKLIIIIQNFLFFNNDSNYFQNIYIGHIPQIEDTPGPGAYPIGKTIFGGDKPKISIKAKLQKMNNKENEFKLPPNIYVLNEKVLKSSRYEKVTQGFGKKFDFTIVSNDNSQGPASYNIPSGFIKKTHNVKLRPSQKTIGKSQSNALF